MSVDADIDSSEDLFGKTVSDLQDNIQIIDDMIGGKLLNVADYTAAGFDMDEGTHFIALHAETTNNDAVITVEVLGGQRGPVVVFDPDSAASYDGICIGQLTSNGQKLRFVATKNGLSEVKIFDLSHLTFAAAE